MLNEENQDIKKDKLKYRLLRGFKDILPDEWKYWQHIIKTVAQVARDYNFNFINTPIIEESALFERTAGESSDVVSKELFRFRLPKGDDKEETGKEVALRPEGTAAIMRAYIEHGLLNKPQPVKLWSVMPIFRYDKPQAGRYRQHYQWDFEIIGEDHPVTDAQVITVMHKIYKTLGLDVVIAINSLGTPESRTGFIEHLKEYYEPKTRSLCPDCRKRLKNNPLRLLDCKTEDCQPLIAEAPQIVDYLDEESREHFIGVLEFLDELDIPYALHPRLVRGFDYYTHTVFEVYLNGDYQAGRKLDALGGGGRYNGLAAQLGGRPTPAVGAGAGLERLILAFKSQGVSVPPIKQYDLFLAQLGPEARRRALGLYEKLIASGWSVAENFSKDGLAGQLERANKLGSQLTLILGQKEILEDTIIIRDMSSGIQEEVRFDRILGELDKRIKKVKIIRNGNPTKSAGQPDYGATITQVADAQAPDSQADGNSQGDSTNKNNHYNDEQEPRKEVDNKN